jgi:hypothetical protein
VRFCKPFVRKSSTESYGDLYAESDTCRQGPLPFLVRPKPRGNCLLKPEQFTNYVTIFPKTFHHKHSNVTKSYYKFIDETLRWILNSSENSRQYVSILHCTGQNVIICDLATSFLQQHHMNSKKLTKPDGKRRCLQQQQPHYGMALAKNIKSILLCLHKIRRCL